MPDLRNIAIWLLLALAVAGWGVSCAERTRAGHATKQRDQARLERDTARGERNTLADAVTAQKAEAAATLRTLQASVLAQQKRIDEARAAQEKADVTATKTITDLRSDLRRIRAAARSVLSAAESAGRGGSGRGAEGGPATSAEPGAGGAAEADRVLPRTPDEEGDEDAFDADQINAAYASCRADAYSVRALKK